MNEHECEPIRGLPAPLPEGEQLLWQGSPRWTAMAIQAFHVRKVALYFAALMIWRAIDVVTAGESMMEATLSALWLLPLAATAIGLLALLGWLTSRATVYTITSRRVVIRLGVAISLSVNIPFCLIEAAALKSRADGTGDIPLVLKRGERISYLVAWPHVRPWRLRQPEPMLRAPSPGRKPPLRCWRRPLRHTPAYPCNQRRLRKHGRSHPNRQRHPWLPRRLEGAHHERTV